MNNEQLDLNAYVDGELSTEQEAEIVEAMQHDPALAREVCRLGQLKAQLRIAYATPPQPDRRPTRRMRAAGRMVAVAGALLVVGALAGWLAHSGLTTATETGRVVVLDPHGRGRAPADAEARDTRIVFHLTNADPMIAGELLDEVEGMLRAYRADGRPLRVEVVSHNDGLELLRASLTEYASRIHELASAYDNLTFVACKNSIDRLRVDHGIEVHLVPDAETTRSGVTHVVRRQRQGWAYIRV